MFSKVITIGLAALIATPASAFIRFSCANNLVEERADPIVAPNEVAGHAHKIVGGNGFGFNMSYEQARGSQCSSCPIKQDFSNYWTPKLYFQNGDGTFQSVPTVGDNAQDLNGGQTVYYLQRGPTGAPLKAFPPGFRMLAGDSTKRSMTTDMPGQAVSFACLGGPGQDTLGFPNYNCPGGLRAQVFFPSCWDGVNLDSADHKSHMSYPATGAYNNPTTCPSTHPVMLVSLFFEVLYDTNSFAGKWGSSNQPFVLSNGDATGYGFHGDFVNGWDVPTLQTIVDTCTDLNAQGQLTACPIIEQFTDAEQNACRQAPQINEQIRGTLPALPGCNPVTSGPAAASNGVCPGQTAAVIGPEVAPFTDVSTTKGWGYVGCGADNMNPRPLNDKSTQYLANAGTNMTVENCMDFCEGYTYAGLEYASQCFCGNTLAANGVPQAGILGNCNMACAGDSKELCGGPSALAIYQKCAAGSTCTNAGGVTGSTPASGSIASVSSAASVVAPTSAASSSTSAASSLTAAVVSSVKAAVSSSSGVPVVRSASTSISIASYAAPSMAATASSSPSIVVAPVENAASTVLYSYAASPSTLVTAVVPSATTSGVVVHPIATSTPTTITTSTSHTHTATMKTVYVTLSASGCKA